MTDMEMTQKQVADETNGEATWEGAMFRPNVDIVASAEGYTLMADMPGVLREDLEIHLHEGVLTLLGRVRPLGENFAPVYEEYRHGGWRRRFNLTDDIDADGIDATLRDGVLSLKLPRAKAAMPRKIAIKTG
jgi:HSP20 family molecular chaperone IbpA